ncbi:MAG: hypothetical protein V4714_21380 [Bacteroidota bacterium]
MTDFQTFVYTIQALEQAAHLIECGQRHQAELAIHRLPAACYEMALTCYARHRKDYFYYLSRFVIGSLECCYELQPAPEDMENYRLQLLIHSECKPVKVWINKIDYEIDWQMWRDRRLQAA